MVSYKPGAGFIVCRKFKDGIKFLGLKAPKFIRDVKKGTWDIPKGQKDPGESDWETAQRETLEEAGLFIIQSDCMAGPFTSSSLTVYLVKTDSDPRINANPTSGIIEHESWEWLSGDELLENCYIWLKPFIEWGISNLTQPQYTTIEQS